MGYTGGVIWTDEAIASGIMEIANLFEPIRMPTRSEISEMRGDEALTNAISKHGGFGFWADKLGLEQKYSETRLGIEGEQYIANILRSMGHKVETTSVKYPYDLLIDDCIKVDVKTANESSVRGFPIHSYRLAKEQQTCDFYILYEADTKRVYVIPANKLYGQVQVGMGLNSNTYAQYLGAYHLIQQAVEMYQGM